MREVMGVSGWGSGSDGGGSAILRPLLQRTADAEASRRLRDFSAEAVAEILAYGAVVGNEIEIFPRHNRCMDHARQLIRAEEAAGRSFPSGKVLIARELAAGRGRFARDWHAPTGGLWLTLVLVNTLLPQHGRFYPLAAGVACAETLRSFGIDAKVKWVNDVLVDSRKIAGVLTETAWGSVWGPPGGTAEGGTGIAVGSAVASSTGGSVGGATGREEYVLIGIGINVNNDRFPPELADLALAMKDVLGRSTDLNELTARLLTKLRWNIGLLHYVEDRQLAEEGDSGEPPAYHPLLRAWRDLSDTIGRRVLFGFDVQRSPQYEAVVDDIDHYGGLVLRQLHSSIRTTEYAGEIIYLQDQD